MKRSLKVIMVVLCFALIIGAVSAKGNSPGDTGKSYPLFINLTEKTPVDTDAYPWVVGGGFGKLQYKTGPSAMFVFNAGKMTPYTEYSLISYKEPWPGTGSTVIGTAFSDGSGAVSIKGKYDVTTKFLCNKYPTPTSREYQVNGTKIWLVPTDNLTFDDSTAVFIDWAPTDYLFETDLVNKSCMAPEEPAICDDQDACTTDTYDAGTGMCIHRRIICDDGNTLTTDTCDSGTGECSYTPCVSRYGDCDGQYGNGCEIDLRITTDSCGSCRNACPAVPNGVPSCSDGICGFGSCDADWGDCTSDPGCETPLTTTSDCGSCGNACISDSQTEQQCSVGECTLSYCNGDYGNCDSDEVCETDLNNDVDNCGACDNACKSDINSTPNGCSSGSCSYTCEPGYADCNEGNSVSSLGFGDFTGQSEIIIPDGCETPITTTDDCGSCGNICPNTDGTPACDTLTGTCYYVTCNNSDWADCNMDEYDGCETDITTDTNCGECKKECDYGWGCRDPEFDGTWSCQDIS